MMLRGYNHFPRHLAARLASVLGVEERPFIHSGYLASERALFENLDSGCRDSARASLLDSLYTMTGDPVRALAYRRYNKLREQLGEHQPLKRLFEVAAATVDEISVDEIYAEPTLDDAQ
jgi:hypothetical protein